MLPGRDGAPALGELEDWRALLPTRVAVLDESWTARLAHRPELTALLVERAIAQSRRLADTMAITSQPRMDARIWRLLWQLADRFGQVGADGVHLPLPLSHAALAHMARATRPSVTATLSQLTRRGVLRRAADHWVLLDRPAATGDRRRPSASQPGPAADGVPTGAPRPRGARWHPRRALVLDEDPELAELVPAPQRDQARLESRASILELPSGAWSRARDTALPDGVGLLVLEGLLARRVTWDDRSGCELLDRGCLARPWQGAEEWGRTIQADAGWHVIDGARLAVLDRAWAVRMSRFPGVGAALVRRALERSERLLVTMSIGHRRRLEDRIWLLLWYLADRHGRVHPDGVHLDLRLTHELLGHLTGAQRPSVTLALGRLAADGRVQRRGRTWLLGDGAAARLSAGIPAPDRSDPAG